MEDNEADLLETAYLRIYNHMGEEDPYVPTSTTKRMLSGQGVPDVSGSGGEDIILKVKFNPQTISFSSGGLKEPGSSIATKTSILQSRQGEVASADIYNLDSRVTVSIQLTFDRTVYKKDSVLEEVEGFLAIIQNPYVREVRFYWGKQCYIGQIKSLSADYLMFNGDGYPIRATVDFSMNLM